MSLDTVLSQLGLQRQDPHTLNGQLQAMRRDVQRLGRALTTHATHNVHDWPDHIGEFSRDAARQTAHLAAAAGTQARRGAGMVRRDPLPVIAIIGTGLLLARLLRRG